MDEQRTGVFRFLADVVGGAKELADGTLGRLSAAEEDFRRGLTRIVENKHKHKNKEKE